MTKPNPTDQEEGKSSKSDNSDKVYYDTLGVSLAFDLGGRTIGFRLVDLNSFQEGNFNLISVQQGVSYSYPVHFFQTDENQFVYKSMLKDLVEVFESIDLLGQIKSLYSMGSFPLDYYPNSIHSCQKLSLIHGRSLDKLTESSEIHDISIKNKDVDSPETSSRHLEYLILTHIFAYNTSGCYNNMLPQVTDEAPQEQEAKFAKISSLVINGIRKLIDNYVNDFSSETLSQFTVEGLDIKHSMSKLCAPYSPFWSYCMWTSKAVAAYRLNMLLEGLKPKQIEDNIYGALSCFENMFEKEAKRVTEEYNQQHSEELKTISDEFSETNANIREQLTGVDEMSYNTKYQELFAPAHTKFTAQLDEHNARLQVLLSDVFVEHKRRYQEALKDFTEFMKGHKVQEQR